MSDEIRPGWEVTGPGREETVLSDSGTGLRQVYVVPYKITTGPARGHRSNVRVPADDYHPDGVRMHIDTEAAAHHQVAALRNDNA